MKAEKRVRYCDYCGCTDAKACRGGCGWAGPFVCSRCVEDKIAERVETRLKLWDGTAADDLSIQIVRYVFNGYILAGKGRLK